MDHQPLRKKYGSAHDPILVAKCALARPAETRTPRRWKDAASRKIRLVAIESRLCFSFWEEDMCGRYRRTTQEERAHPALSHSDPERRISRYNIAPSRKALTIRFNPETRARSLDALLWGTHSPLGQNLKIAYRTINARADTVDKALSIIDYYPITLLVYFDLANRSSDAVICARRFPAESGSARSIGGHAASDATRPAKPGCRSA